MSKKPVQKKPGRGRPAFPPENVLSEIVPIRLSKSDREAVEEELWEGETLSEVCRTLLLAWAKRRRSARQ